MNLLFVIVAVVLVGAVAVLMYRYNAPIQKDVQAVKSVEQKAVADMKSAKEKAVSDVKLVEGDIKKL